MSTNNTPAAQKTGWFTAVSFGMDYDGPTGPWKSLEAAERAITKHLKSVNWYLGASNLRVLGPIATRSEAMKACISDDCYPIARSYR